MGKRKEFTGEVLKSNMQKTAVVRVLRTQKHPKYSRIVRKYNKFKVHDENNSAKPGDVVRIAETRPISKEKHFRLLAVVKKAALPDVELKDEVK